VSLNIGVIVGVKKFNNMNTQRRTDQRTIDFIEAPFSRDQSDQLKIISDIQKVKKDLLLINGRAANHWLRALDLYDKGITEHTLRVTSLSLRLAKGLGLSKKELLNIQLGTLLHDIGKLGVPERIMQKPGRLTPYEFQVVQEHPIYALEWLTRHPEYQPAMVIPLYHHEWWDGSGYPFGLAGEEIPLPARIVAVADVWDALTSDRPYRKAMEEQKALAIISGESGTHFDPSIVDAFLEIGLFESQYMSVFISDYV
jgi:HD-GYP domain-containing protein (c-di-GMP phosphodiesterase class II)